MDYPQKRLNISQKKYLDFLIEGKGVETKEKIVIIGANSFQNRLIIKAKELGYETHVFAWQCGDPGEFSADYFYPISITEKEEILSVCRKINPVAVCSIASDLAVLTVNYVARQLNLPANSAWCDRVSTNKYEMRKVLKEAGIRTPQFLKIHSAQELAGIDLTMFTFPIIVKPTDRSGSRAITKLTSQNGLLEAVQDAMDQSFEHAAIVEEFLEGKEYSCESISFQGKHTMLAITEKFTTGEPHFIETGHIEPALLGDDIKEKVRTEVFRALDALGIKDSASHAEFKIDPRGEIAIIEIGARMGGDCIGSDLVYLSTGNDYMKMVIDVARGREPEIEEDQHVTNAAIRFLMGKEDMAVENLARKEFGEVIASNIESVTEQEVVDSSTRYGYFIVTHSDGQKLRTTLFGSK